MFYPQGLYWGPLSKVVAGVTEKGTPYLAIEFKVSSKLNAKEEWDVFDESEQELRTIFMYLSDEAIQYTMPQLEKLGFNGDFANPAISPPETWNGGVVAQCKHDTYQGKPKEKWSLPGSGAGGSLEHKPMTADDIRKFNTIWKNKGGSKKPAGPPSAPKATGAPVVAGASDEAPWNK